MYLDAKQTIVWLFIFSLSVKVNLIGCNLLLTKLLIKEKSGAYGFNQPQRYKFVMSVVEQKLKKKTLQQSNICLRTWNYLRLRVEFIVNFVSQTGWKVDWTYRNFKLEILLVKCFSRKRFSFLEILLYKAKLWYMYHVFIIYCCEFVASLNRRLCYNWLISSCKICWCRRYVSRTKVDTIREIWITMQEGLCFVWTILAIVLILISVWFWMHIMSFNWMRRIKP